MEGVVNIHNEDGNDALLKANQCFKSFSGNGLKHWCFLAGPSK